MPAFDLRSAVVLAVATFLTCASVAADSVKINVDENNVAIGGYDTVAYFTLAKPTKGDPRIEVKWADARWQFVSAEHRDMFLRDPDRYAPRFGGFCALGISRGYLSIVDPEAWQIVGDRLFLAYDKKSKDLIQENVPVVIDRATTNWQTLRRH